MCSSDMSVIRATKMVDIEAALQAAQAAITVRKKTRVGDYELFFLNGGAKLLWGVETGGGKSFYHTRVGPAEVVVLVSQTNVVEGHVHWNVDLTMTVGGSVTNQKNTEFDMYHDEEKNYILTAGDNGDVFSQCVINCLNKICSRCMSHGSPLGCSGCVAGCTIKCAFTA